jgi:hypothetical protein
MTPPGKNVGNEVAHFESLGKEFQDAMISEPFGNKDRATKAANDLASWADALIESRSKGPFVPVNQDRARALLMQLCEASDKTSLDYDSARQTAWAFRAIYEDLVRYDAKNKNPAIEQALGQIGTSLLTALPAAGQQIPIEKTLKSRLESAGNFDSVDVAKLFGELKKLVVGH